MTGGIFSEYLNTNFSIEDIHGKRKAQLKCIADLRERDVFVYAAAMEKTKVPNSILYADIRAVLDQMDSLSGKALDVILETPGGSGEIAEDIVKIFRDKYDDVAFIIPGCAKSAGTIMVMSGDAILMEPSSSLGPIEAQMNFRGQIQSALALIEGLEKIKNEVLNNNGVLNSAYYPMLQNLTPGDIETAENAMNFSQDLVADWLKKYKFKKWTTHSSSGKSVSDEEKESRALEIAKKLGNHSHWKTHARSIKINDLEEMQLKITNYKNDPPLFDAIRRYYILLGMTFDRTGIFKIFETPKSQIYRYDTPQNVGKPTYEGLYIVEVDCLQCKQKFKVQVNFGKPQPLGVGLLGYPKSDILECPNCKNKLNLLHLRNTLEMGTGGKVVPEHNGGR